MFTHILFLAMGYKVSLISLVSLESAIVSGRVQYEILLSDVRHGGNQTEAGRVDCISNTMRSSSSSTNSRTVIHPMSTEGLQLGLTGHKVLFATTCLQFQSHCGSPLVNDFHQRHRCPTREFGRQKLYGISPNIFACFCVCVLRLVLIT